MIVHSEWLPVDLLDREPLRFAFLLQRNNLLQANAVVSSLGGETTNAEDFGEPSHECVFCATIASVFCGVHVKAVAQSFS